MKSNWHMDSTSVFTQPITVSVKDKGGKPDCAAKALFSCPAIISQRLESRIISNEPLENTEEESKII